MTNLQQRGRAPRSIWAYEERAGRKFQKILVDSFSPSTSLVDSFGRVRVSNPATIFESGYLAGNKNPLLWDESLESGSGITSSTPTAAKPYLDYTSTLNTAGVFTRQTFRRMHYQRGKSQLVNLTGVIQLSGGGTGVKRRIGYFDDDNGAFFEDSEGTVGIVIRSNDSGTPSDTRVAQADWNMDKLDGTGTGDDPDYDSNPSGITVDWSKAQIFVIDFQWLSIGIVHFGVQIDGILHYVHKTSPSNTSAIPWSSTPNLPIRYQMVTTASSPASTMREICHVVISEGGNDPVGVPHSEATVNHVNANAADTFYALVGIRLKAAAVGCTVILNAISILSESNDDFEWTIFHNPTVAGTFTYGDKDNSCVQTALGANANTVTLGTPVQRGFGSQTAARQSDVSRSVLRLGSAIDGTLDTLVLCARPLGTNADIQGCMNWLEFF